MAILPNGNLLSTYEHVLAPRSSYRVVYKGGREIHFYFSAKIGEDGFFWVYKFETEEEALLWLQVVCFNECQ
jgi:hypothetical protein